MDNERRPAGAPQRRRPDSSRPEAAQRPAGQRRPPRQGVRKRKKKRVRTAPNVGLRWKLLTMAAVVAAIVLGFTIFFKVQHIEVRGNKYYTAQEVAAACGVEAGDNLLTVSKATVAARITAELPYISEVQVKRGLPNTLAITVGEYDVSYAVKDSAGAWWLMNRAGRILESASEQTVKSHIVINGLVIVPPTIGAELQVEGTQTDPTDEELSEEAIEQLQELSARKDVVLKVLQEMELRPFAKELVSVEVTASYDVSLWYGTRYQIRLGICDRLSKKFDFLEVVLKELEPDNSEGVINITFTEGEIVRFQPFQEN